MAVPEGASLTALPTSALLGHAGEGRGQRDEDGEKTAFDRSGETVTRRERMFWKNSLPRESRRCGRDRHDPSSWYLLGVLYIRVGKPEIALRKLDRSISLDPDDASSHFERGNALFDLGRHAEAVEAYGRTLKGECDDLRPVAFYNRGLARSNLGEPETAIRDYGEALTLRPDYADALNNRGDLLNDAGRHAEALVDLDRGVALEPGDSTIHGNRATALVGLRRYEEALQAAERALGIDRRNRTALYEKARALAGLGHVEEAVDWLRWVMQGDIQRTGDAKDDPVLTPVWSQLQASDSTVIPT